MQCLSLQNPPACCSAVVESVRSAVKSSKSNNAAARTLKYTLYAGAGKQPTQTKRAEELDVDEFLNGGFMAVDSDREQDSDIADSSEDEAGAAALDSDDEQDAYDATSAAADDASDSDGVHRVAWLQLQ